MDRFNGIFSKVFMSSKKAILYCQNLARLCGFSVRIRTSKTTTIYIVCSREGLPEPNRDQSKKRGRNSERCNCDWRIVLCRRAPDQWEFRRGKTMEHNHVVFSSEAFLDADISPMPQPTIQQTSSQQCSPLPSLRSLDLPFHHTSGSISPTSGFSPGPSIHNIHQLPPLTKALSKIMQRPTPYSRPNSISFLLN
ncbi:hypothetical protein DSO57_1011889 [Entomophthora muscae]|uniref:Uncharacterized protein n=1 Tax=Entomophthora muscae TaxID=34485 RepID=A0ACC2TTI9_9FUNG|nr:hypothetical protein DSO57_1011889 [Entomophthora muscae]